MLCYTRITPCLKLCQRSPSFSRQPCRQKLYATAVAALQPPTQVNTGVEFPSRSKALKLRPYQEECVQAVLTAFREGLRQIGVSLATGSGKTVIFTELIGRMTPLTPQATKTLILVHRRELVEQAARQSSRRYPEKSVDIEMGSLHASGQADITIASVQSITSRDRMDKFDPGSYKLILVDEAHHIVSPAYLKVLGHFGLVPQEATEKPEFGPALLGVSATLSRLDGLALGKVIKHIVYHKDYIDMIGEKWLSDVIFTSVASHADLSRVKKGVGGDFQTSALSQAVNTDETNLITVRAWQHRASGRKSTIVFCVDLEHVKTLTNTFRAHGIDARFVTGDTNKVVRSSRLDSFRNGEFPVLVNCGVFTEGTDIPNIDCVLLARPTKSRNLLVQMIGRGMRLHPGKQNCHIIDMVASLKTGIVTTPTLFGLDPSELVQEMDTANLQKLKERKESEKLREQAQGLAEADPSIIERHLQGTVTFTDYDSVADLIDDTSGDRHIRAISPNSWVHVPTHDGQDRYVLVNGSSGSYLMLEKAAPPSNSYSVTLTLKLLGSDNGTRNTPFMRPRKILNADTFEAAVRGADTYASTHFTRILIRTFTRDGWRNRPASQAQVDFLNKYRDEQHELSTEDINKGKAGDMITKIKFGARGRFAKVVKNRNREERERKKVREWENFKEREVVKVGPLGAGDGGHVKPEAVLPPTEERMVGSQGIDLKKALSSST